MVRKSSIHSVTCCYSDKRVGIYRVINVHPHNVLAGGFVKDDFGSLYDPFWAEIARLLTS